MMNIRPVQTVTNRNRTNIAPRLTLKEPEILEGSLGCARIQLEISPGVPALSFSFIDAEKARSAMEAPQFLSCAIWKSLPIVADQMIDALVEGFIRPQDLYDRHLSFNKTANHHLREAGVSSISPAIYH